MRERKLGLTRLACELPLLLCHTVQRGLRQRTLQHSGQRAFELLGRGHADQDRAHCRVGHGESDGGLGQTPGQSFVDQWPEAPRAREIGVVADGRSDRLRRRAGDGMALARTGQCASGQHTNAYHADTGGLGVVEQPSVVLRRIVRRQATAAEGLSML